MEKMKYIALLLTGTLFFAGCYEDKGNYVYKTLPDIEIEGIEENYNRIVALESLDIDVTLTTDYPESELEYRWILTKGTTAESDTIGREKNLRYSLADFNPSEQGVYSLIYQVNHLDGSGKPDYTVYATSKVSIETPFARGFYILKEKNGKSDVDFYSADRDDLVEDIFATYHGGPLAGKPRSLGQLPQYPYVDPATITRTHGQAMGITTDEEAVVLLTDDLSIIHDISTLLITVTGRAPYRFVRGHSRLIYTSEDGIYVIKCGDATYGQLSTGRFGLPVEVGEVTYPGSKWMCYDHTYSFLVWLELERRFVKITTWLGSNSVFRDNPDPDGDMVYTGTIYTGGAANMYGFFKDNGVVSYYKLSSSGNQALGDKKTFAADSKFHSADCYVTTLLSGNYFYCVNGGKLYNYNVAAEVENEITPAGIDTETITYVTNRYWRTWAGGDDEALDYLVVGTSFGSNYTLRMYNIKNGVTDGEPIHTISGEGTIADVQFMSPLIDPAAYLYNYFPDYNYGMCYN